MRGMTVQIAIKTQTGVDALNNPIFTESYEDVPDVLVGQPTTDDITSSIQLYGKRCEYTLGIPRGDDHDWTDTKVIIFGKAYRTIGEPMRGIDANIPLRWNRNVKVERYG